MCHAIDRLAGNVRAEDLPAAGFWTASCAVPPAPARLASVQRVRIRGAGRTCAPPGEVRPGPGTDAEKLAGGRGRGSVRARCGRPERACLGTPSAGRSRSAKRQVPLVLCFGSCDAAVWYPFPRLNYWIGSWRCKSKIADELHQNLSS
jgi:hypothetical protein